MAPPSSERVTSKGGDAIRALRRTPRWAVVTACLVALSLTWFAWKLVGLSERDTITIDLAAEAFPEASLSYSSAPFGMGAREFSITPEEVTPSKVDARATTLTVTPVGRANPQSQGNEIWVLEVASEYARVGGASWAQMTLPKSWTASNGAALNASGAQVSLLVGLDAGSYVDATFVTHPWSGRVRLEADGRSREIDLYAPESGQGTFRLMLPVSPGVPQSVAKAIPRSTGDLTLRFPEGPRTVRLVGARREGDAVWTWRPEATENTVFGPSVKVLSRDSGGVLIEVPSGGGWVRLSKTAEPYWMPKPKDLAAVLGTLAAIVGLGLLGAAVVGARAGAVTFLGSLRPGRASVAPAPGRRQVLIDGLVLVAASAWLFVVVGGVLLAVYDAAAHVNALAALRAVDSTVLVPGSGNIGAWAPETPRLWRWWAGRPVPNPDGGDYLRVLSRESGETIADILGFTVSRMQGEGVRVERVIIPKDLKALYGQEPFYDLQGSTGYEFRTGWQVLSEVGTFFTDVPYVSRDYDPILSEQQRQAILGTTKPGPEWSVLAVGQAREGASGTWVLYAVPTTPRRYVLAPIESSPLGRRP